MKKPFLLASSIFLSWGVYRITLGSVAADEPLCVVTHVDVLPPFTAPGRELLLKFAADSRKDAGAERIEVFEEIGRPNHSTLVEVWKDRKSFEEHLATDQTRAFRSRLQPMLGSPFDERLHRASK